MARGRKEAFSFRDLTMGLVMIVNDRNLPVVKTMFEFKPTDNAILAVGYIDHTAGITFEVLCLGEYRSTGGINLSRGERTASFKIRYDGIDGVIVLLDDACLPEFQDKIDMIRNGYQVNEAIQKSRNSFDFDDFRHPQFPDDVMLYFCKEKGGIEGIWCRIETEIDGLPAARMMNEPNADFGVHRGDLVKFEWTKNEGKMIGIAVLPWMDKM